MVSVPEWIDTKARGKVQAYLDYAEWQIAAGYDAVGFPHEESDRRAASTITGGLFSAVAGAEIVSVPAAGLGCGVGAVVGGIAGGILGTAAAGIGALFGMGLGAGAGCLAGIVVGAVPGIIVGAGTGAVLGAAAGAALGGGVDVVKPDVPPLIDAATEPGPMNSVPVVEDPPITVDPVTVVVQQAVATVTPAIEGTITSLSTAVGAFPPMDPEFFGPFVAPVRDLVAAATAGL